MKTIKTLIAELMAIPAPFKTWYGKTNEAMLHNQFTCSNYILWLAKIEHVIIDFKESIHQYDIESFKNWVDEDTIQNSINEYKLFHEQLIFKLDEFEMLKFKMSSQVLEEALYQALK